MNKSTLMLAIVALAGSAAVADTSIETFSAWDGANVVAQFGETDTATYGQTFVCPADAYMTDFTFTVNDFLNTDVVDFQAYVYAWDGSKATGPALHASGPYSTTNNGGADGFENITINTGALALTPGNAYVAFFCASNLFDGETGTSSWGLVNGDAYGSGGFVFLNNGNDFSHIDTQTWSSFGPIDVAFSMNFKSVPAPSAAALLGLGALAAGRRRR